MNTYNLFATKDDKQDNIPSKEKGRLSDIISMSQDISGDWLRKVGENRVVIQEQIQNQKEKGKK